MQRILGTIILLAISVIAFSQETINLKRVYKNVDKEVEKWSEYRSDRQVRIDSMVRELYTEYTHWADTQYVKCSQIVDEYQDFQNDSAIYYIKMLDGIASWTTNVSVNKAWVKLKMARQAVRSGMYEAALSYINDVDTTQIGCEGKIEYFRVRHFTFVEMGAYCYIWSKRQEYDEKAHQCRVKLSALLEEGGSEWFLYKSYDELLSKHFKEAERLSDLCLKSCPRYSDLYRQAAFYRRFICESLKKETEACYWQAESAISELRLGITDQVGLWSLAEKMGSDEVNRKYRYIRFSWDVISSFGKNARTWQVAPVLSAVEREYQDVQEKQRNIIIAGSIVLLCMLVLLTLEYIYVNKKRHQLSEANEKLADYNARLSLTNYKLADANRVKESYIVQLLGYNSEYIDDKEEERRTLSKLHRTGKNEELIKMLNAADKTAREHGKLLARFDDIFLELYPTFIDDFNALLCEKSRFTMNRKERMNTPLRIFALMRLGIDNTQDVARILNCSTQTIYNYRNSIRNAYLYDRNEFEDAVKSIGMSNKQL